MKSHRLPIGATKKHACKIPDRIEDLLARDDINGILKDIDNIKPNIQDLIVLYTDKDGRWHFTCNDDMLISTGVWMLEGAKYELLVEDDEE